MTGEPRGSLWRRWDLHFHTPASYDYEDKSVTNQQIVDRLVAEEISAVVISDHHTIDVDRIRDLQKRGAGKLTVLPGIELRSDQGGDPIHYICIFADDCNLEDVWTTLQGSLDLTPTDVRNAGGDDCIYVPIEKAAKAVEKLRGVISIHAGAKSNSIEGIRNKEQFQQKIKFNITNQYVDIMEIGQLKDIDSHLNVIFPKINIEMPLVLCSDNHDIKNYTVKTPLWLRADPNFRGLLMAIEEPRDRIFIGIKPEELIRVERNPTKHIRSLSFTRRATAPNAEKWFDGVVAFNPGLVAIVGNKGSGKSALSDTLGLLGATKNSASFSFLTSARFRHITGGHANHFDATIEWNSGESFKRCLADEIAPEEIERVKYLPQDHLEKVCNELAVSGEEGFERELKSVIFSHVPDSQRLGFSTLDELISYQADEKQKRIDSLIKQLREVNRLRAQLEIQSDPVVRLELTEKIKRCELELEIHDKSKPAEIPDPSANEAEKAVDPAILKELGTTEAAKITLIDLIESHESTLKIEERRLASARRLSEKVINFRKDFDVFKNSLTDEAAALNLNSDDLVKISIDASSVESICAQAEAAIEKTKNLLEAMDPPGLRKQLEDADRRVTEARQKLDAPNRIYQSYLNDLAEWNRTRDAIIGTADHGESLKGCQAALSALDELPEKLNTARAQQTEIAIKIHTEKLALAAVYRELYGPVQSFIDSHQLAKNKLKLEFRADLVCEDFSSHFLNLLALNRKGSFMGADDGRLRAEKLVEKTDWESEQSVRSFLVDIDTALHKDLRDEKAQVTQLKAQLPKGTKPEDVFHFLYGIEYIRPRYVLKWEGRDLSMLSPGERGTLLLVFYLLIDKGDIPIVIDQPEGNLDNHTVAKVLVDCIKESRKRRQVFIVTHNPNLAVVCDADQVVHARIDKENGNAITYTSGSLENPSISRFVTDVLEGTRWAFGVRDNKYQVGEVDE